MNNSKPQHISVNIMEELVAEEVARQMSRYPENITQYINQVEVATFALNRLPSLYASSHKGLNKQKLKGKSDFSVQITRAVRQGFAAVQKDVLRYSVPLQSREEIDTNVTQNQELEEARRALKELAKFFPKKEVSWSELVNVVKPLLQKHYSSHSETKKSLPRRRMWF